MKKLQELHDHLENMRFDLHDNYRVDLKERFEIVGKFVGEGLQDAVNVIDQAIDRIRELETELAESQEQIEELERESA